MGELQATYVSSDRLFFWSPASSTVRAMERDVPALTAVPLVQEPRTLLVQTDRLRRRTYHGYTGTLRDVAPILVALDAQADVSDSVRCWSAAAKLGLELAARCRAVPTVHRGEARWRALLTRHVDRERFHALTRALPPAGRSLATDTPGRRGLRLNRADVTVRAYLDAIIDGVYRQGGWPGSARGWVLELAEALRGEEPAFNPRDARHQAIPDLLTAWSTEAEAAELRVAFRLRLPTNGEAFGLQLLVHPMGLPEVSLPLAAAWQAGVALDVQGQTTAHPAHAALVALARARHLFEPLSACLDGPEPTDLAWDANQTWRFIDEGTPRLRKAGFEVFFPDEFAKAGRRRIRARMRLEDPLGPDGRIDLGGVLSFQWEVVLGDIVLTGNDFAELTALDRPVVQFRGEWVLLDPDELARLPAGLPDAGTLPAPDALRAVLVGEHEGIPVVADDRLALVLQAVREPPRQRIPRGLTATLRPYQRDGYDWLATLGELGLGACLADDMGLGKTVQLIAHLLRRRERRRRLPPSLVICPTSVLGNWQRELKRFAPRLRVLRYHGPGRDPMDAKRADVVLTTYGLLVRDREDLAACEWDVVTLDEAQAIKNPSSQRARAARALQARHRVALTGTPIENRLEELWSLLEFLVPGLLGARATFLRNVALPIERFGDDAVAQSLRQGIAPFLKRRLKTDPDVIPDLPEKMERSEHTSLTAEQARLYEQVVDEAMSALQGVEAMERRGRVLAMLTALKQVCNHPDHYLKQNGELAHRSGKLERCVELLESILDGRERALVFTQYRQMGVRLKRHFEDRFGVAIPFLHGGTPTHRRDQMVAAFQSGGSAPPILLVSLRAGGTGLNLTAATHVIHYDRWWNPAVEDQATDRAHRIGQHRRVQVHKLICQGTLEERIDAILEEKRALADSVVGASEQWVTELDDQALRRLVALGADAVVEEQP